MSDEHKWKQLRSSRLWPFFVALCAAIVAVIWLPATRSQINQNNYDRIQDGMTLSEVNAILGVPPGDRRTREVMNPQKVAPEETWWRHDNHSCSSAEYWVSDEGWIWVGFSSDGRAVGKRFSNSEDATRRR
jgi:hypothetical protein